MGVADDRLGIVLDHLPHGRPDDDRPQYQKPEIAYAVEHDSFGLFECELADDADVTIGEETAIDGENVERVREIEYDDLTSGARSEIEYAIRAIIESDEQRFVGYYNEAQPITLRLHQLNLLPGIGKKLRNNILDQRNQRPFESFEDIEDRVSGLHTPAEILGNRIHEEIREDDLKYRSFVQ